MTDFLKLVGPLGVFCSLAIGLPAVYYIDPNTSGGKLVVLGVGAFVGFCMAAVLRFLISKKDD